MIFVRCAAFSVGLFILSPQYMQLTYTPDKPRLFLLREQPEDPQFEPHAGIKIAHGLVSPSSISVVDTQTVSEMIFIINFLVFSSGLNHQRSLGNP